MKKSTNPIGVFDSGVGGITVLKELKELMPNESFIYLGDSKNAPYGTKSEETIKAYTKRAVSDLADMGVKAVVIACNTATSVAAEELRKTCGLPIIGIEPAVKPAAINHKGETVIVMATPVTLKKEKFIKLMESYSEISKIIPLPCPGLVELIERGITEGGELEGCLNDLFEPFEKEKIGSIVLGCTHYPFIRDAVKKHFDYDVDIIDGGKGTAKETKRRLEAEGLINTFGGNGEIRFISTKDRADEEIMIRMYEKII